MEGEVEVISSKQIERDGGAEAIQELSKELPMNVISGISKSNGGTLSVAGTATSFA